MLPVMQKEKLDTNSWYFRKKILGEKIVKNKLMFLFMATLTIGVVLSGCGEKKDEPENQNTVTETSAGTEASTEAETIAEAEPVTETETTAAGNSLEPTGDNEDTVHYGYEVFTDGQPHRVVYWTDGEIQESMLFTSLSLPGWGIESISLPSEFVEPEAGKEIYVANAEDENDDYIRLAAEKALVDDSYGYPGAWSRRDEWSLFRVWRAEVDESYDFENAYPEKMFNEIYPFVDTGAFLINLDQITKFRNPDGTTDYMINCKNRGHWHNFKKTEDGGYKVEFTKMYNGYILVRPRGNVAHCILFATTDSSWKEECEYIFNDSAVYT